MQASKTASAAIAATLLLAARLPVAVAQEEPSFDCKAARTQVEHVLCSGGDSGMGWIDQTMDQLYKAALQADPTRAGTLRADQRAWLARRDRCRGTDTEVMNCLDGAYRTRFAAIAAPYDTTKVTGWYRNDQVHGFMDAVLFPDRSLAVSASSNAGPPAYDSCSLTLRAPIRGNQVSYDPSTEGDTGEGKCRFELIVSTGQIVVSRDGCEAFCGHSASITGTYQRQR